MSRTHAARRLGMAAAAVVFAVLLAPALRAQSLYVYDQESLAHLSTDVVEAEVVRAYRAHDADLIDVKVVVTHKGALPKGQTVAVAHTDSYRKAGADAPWNNQRLAAGDQLVLFVARARPSDSFRIPDGAVVYAPLPGGVRLVHGEQVIGFSQWSNPGPYVARVPAVPEAGGRTIGPFRESLRGSLRDAEAWAGLVNAPRDQLDVPGLLKLLADRSMQPPAGRDYFTERACVHLAESHDPALLSRALAVAKGHHERSVLHRGFGTREGRDALLARVGDADAPMPDRLRFAAALSEAGAAYRVTFTEIEVNSWRETGEVGADNSGYLTRIARVAAANGRHEELCRRLVHALDHFGQGITQNRSPALTADLRGAFAALKAFHATRPSEELQFVIERATARDRDAYEQLNSSCGPFVSILRPADPTKYTRPEQRSLIFEYEYATTLLDRDAEVRPSVVLVHQGTQRRHTLPTQLRIRGWSTGGGSNAVVLTDVPPGRYKVFFEVRDRERVISTGHSFIADL